MHKIGVVSTHSLGPSVPLELDGTEFNNYSYFLSIIINRKYIPRTTGIIHILTLTNIHNVRRTTKSFI